MTQQQKRTLGIICGILGIIGIIVSFVIGFTPWIPNGLPAFLGVVLIGTALVLLKA